MTCYFCKQSFDELPWWACCGSCYSKSAHVRTVVDAVHPITESRVSIDELMDRELAE